MKRERIVKAGNFFFSGLFPFLLTPFLSLVGLTSEDVDSSLLIFFCSIFYIVHKKNVWVKLKQSFSDILGPASLQLNVDYVIIPFKPFEAPAKTATVIKRSEFLFEKKQLC